MAAVDVAEAVSASAQPVLTLADVGKIQPRRREHVHRVYSVYGSPEDSPRGAVWPPLRVWHLRRADRSLPLLPRASADVGADAHGLRCESLVV